MPIIESNVTYFENVQGFYAKPEGESPANGFPGVVMVHEWWGLNDNIKDMARELAKEGYHVLAVDLYNGEVASTSARAQELRTALVQPKAVENLRAAATYLREQGASKIASLGWCFGGQQSLQLALFGEELAATVIYYGQLETDKAKLSAIKWPVLGIFGDKDTSIPPAKVEAFRVALNDIGVENDIYIYPGVGHAFANPTGQNYAPTETKDAWTKTLAFLRSNLY